VAHQTSAALKIVPAAANPVSVTGNNTSWANSTWGQITTGIAQRVIIHGIVVGAASTTAQEWEVDIGVGAAGSEVVRGTIKSTSESANIDDSPNRYVLPAPIRVAISTRVAVRFRKNGTGTPSFTFALEYEEDPAAVTPFLHHTRHVYL